MPVTLVLQVLSLWVRVGLTPPLTLLLLVSLVHQVLSVLLGHLPSGGSLPLWDPLDLQDLQDLQVLQV